MRRPGRRPRTGCKRKMNRILEFLQRGDRAGAVEALRRLASVGSITSDETSADPRAFSGPPSVEIWVEVLKRIEASGVLAKPLSDDELASIVRSTAAECVRDAIRDESASRRRTESTDVRSTEANPPSATVSVGPLVPDRVGNYLVLRELGAGGFGRVYLAQSDDDLRLPVAIKVLHDPSHEQLQRFTAERSILANLRHPNIARFESSGILSDGRPWIAMEYIEGLPLLSYCERERLSTQQRLELFQKICDAVHEAHKWGIIHLDIKPANIMVTLEGEPKLLDFGIAKIARSLDPTTRATASRGSLTYLYSSPEQLRHEPVSTASDIYNLGLVLYELLTGSRARQSAAKQIDAFIREALTREPELPSKRVEKMADAQLAGAIAEVASPATSITTTSQGGIAKLARKLRGDLDTIVMMAIRIEPLKRYGSAKELAEDIGRHLGRLPIVARKHSLGYRLGMQLQRHRVAVVAALLLVTTAGSVSVAVFAERARRAQEAVVAREREISAQNARIVAVEAEARKARRDLERGPDRQLGWVRLELERNPEVRKLLESRVEDERVAFDLIADLSASGGTQTMTLDHVRWLLETELKLIGLQRRTKSAADLAVAQKSLDALESRLARVPGGVLDETQRTSFMARMLETRAELFGSGTPERKRINTEALALRKKLIELRNSDTQSRYDYGKLLARFVEAANDAGDGATALAHAEEMLAIRESVLADARGDGDPAVTDRRERDVALAHYGIGRAAVGAGDLDRAERAMAESHRMMAERLSRSRPDDRDPEPYVDLARSLGERVTLALLQMRPDDARRHSAEAAERALPAAIACISNVPEFREMLDVLIRRMQLLLLDGTSESRAEVTRLAETVLERLRIADAANDRSVLKDDGGVADRVERIQLLQAEVQSRGPQPSDALVSLADLGVGRSTPEELSAFALRRSVWVAGLIQCRDALRRGRAEDARKWAEFAARAALDRKSSIEAGVCAQALAQIARESGGALREGDLAQLADLRTRAGEAIEAYARASGSRTESRTASAGGD